MIRLIQSELNNKGMLLLEVLVVIVILSGTLTVIVQALVKSLKANVYSRDYTQAVLLMDNKMFDVQTAAITDGLSSSEGPFEEPFETYRYKINVDTPVEEGYEFSEKLRQVTTQVLWPSGRRERKISSTMYVMDRSGYSEFGIDANQ